MHLRRPSVSFFSETIRIIYLWKTFLLFLLFCGISKSIILGREPWSSGFGWWLMFKGRRFESRRHILVGHFSHWFVVKIVCLFEKIENKRKRGRGWHIFLKKYHFQVVVCYFILNMIIFYLESCIQWNGNYVFTKMTSFVVKNNVPKS